jgi:hypothetical protein
LDKVCLGDVLEVVLERRLGDEVLLPDRVILEHVGAGRG